jgi:hypothetical protein
VPKKRNITGAFQSAKGNFSQSLLALVTLQRKRRNSIMSLVNKSAAIEELSSLSRNAKLYLADRLGNNLNAIRLSNHLNQPEDVEAAVIQFQKELDEIKLFE